MKRVALVHDWLTVYAGAERVLEQLLALYPEADLFAVCDFLPEDQRGFLGGRTPHTTFIQHLPGAQRRYRSYLPLMPLAIEQLDLSGYDLVISDPHAVAKGVLTGPHQLHVSYVHTPMRYAWDLQHQYLRESGLDRGLKGALARYALHRLRQWDLRAAAGVDVFVANSRFIARRIRKTYRREAEVVYPPVDVARFAFQADKDDYYLTASRLVPYKRVNLIVEAFARMPDKRLLVVGDGPERSKIEHLAAGRPNIEMRGHVPSEELAGLMARARAFVFAAEEDFGIAPVEAQACGTPVIAYGRGGALETVRGLDAEAPTGVFFDAQTPEAIIKAVRRFEREGAVIRPEACRRNAERFSTQRFREEFAGLVEDAWHRFQTDA
ncbi:glycosyltransferase family 4 protein [Acidihalobacter ferrooxydans]|uniref:Glycosyl transferase family 1 n=1 Tax=Acidihalobacter ferrooxydans TaxID=1765967 RepID=A0A1P8UG60_9GAMM|nr:glycosyltransferase family 4 protein [Acidihalobacter ferrooxydans]APZ42832.1 glycosyl transferase family 1 [Acidihalobacter ferrooxydans]